MFQLWQEDANERYEMDPEAGLIRITDKRTGQVTETKGDPSLMGTSAAPAIPTFPEPATPIPVKAALTDDMLARMGAYRQANGMAPDAPLSDKDLANLTGVQFASTQFQNGHPGPQVTVTPDPTKAAPPLNVHGPPLPPQRGLMDRAKGLAAKFDASGPALEAANRLGLTERPTIGELAVPAIAIPRRAIGALGAASVEIPRMAEAAKPVVKKATHVAKDVLTTPVGEMPKIGASEAAATTGEPPEPTKDSPYAKPEGDAAKGDLVLPKSFAPEPGSEGEQHGPPVPTLEQTIQAILQKKPGNEIQADRWWKSLSGGQRAGLILAAAAGGFNEGFRGVPNRALEMIQGRQQQDVALQESENKRAQEDWRTELDTLLQMYGLESKAAAAAAGDAAGKTVSEGTINTLVDWQNAYDQMFGPQGVYDQFEKTGNNVPLVPEQVERVVGANVPFIETGTKAAMRAQGPAKRSIQKAFSGADVPENQASAIADEFMPIPGEGPAIRASKKRASQAFITGKIASTISTLEAAGYSVERLKARFGSWYDAAKQYQRGSFQAQHGDFVERLIQKGVDPNIVDQPHTDVLNSFVREEP